MKKNNWHLASAIFILFFSPASLPAQQISSAKKILEQAYNLVPKYSRDTQYFQMESRLQKHAPDGTMQSVDTYRLYLRCVPGINDKSKDEYMCMRYTLQLGTAQEIAIPSLANWKYFFSLTGNKDDSLLFGLDHSKFEKLTDANGKELPVENTFHVYNSFVDFHSMSVFSEKTLTGKGVQDLKYVGEKIIHGASFSQPEENLGTQVAKGSYFKNGEITVSFKGLAIENKQPCALLEYDSGESSFFMIVKPMVNMEVPTKGTSHYKGDIYKSLTSGWIQKATLYELVISETTVPGLSNKINSVIERNISIKNVKAF